MQVFVDFLGTSGIYRATEAPSFIDPALPTFVLTGSAFLDAAGEPTRESVCALYHLEQSRFLTASRFREAGVSEFDTIVVVNSDDVRFLAERAVDALWWRAGCAQRRLMHCGMPTAERAALTLYAN
jgi:hypothetical protein